MGLGEGSNDVNFIGGDFSKPNPHKIPTLTHTIQVGEITQTLVGRISKPITCQRTQTTYKIKVVTNDPTIKIDN